MITMGFHPHAHHIGDTIDTINQEDLSMAAELTWATLEPLAYGYEDALLSENEF